MNTLEDIVVTDIREKKRGFINPVAVTFQNGEVVKPRHNKMTVAFYENTFGNTFVDCITSYGHIFKDVKEHDKVKSQLFAIKSKHSNKVRIIEVDDSLLINSALLQPRETSSGSSDYIQNLKALNQAFGGKKALSRLEQRDKLNVNSMLIADELKDSISNISVDDLSMSMYAEKDSITNLLPPQNRNAAVVSEVYSLFDILSAEELEIMKAEIPKETEFKPECFSKFFLECYEAAKKSDNISNDKIAGLLFVELLIRFLAIPAKKLGNKNTSFCKFSDVINSKIQNQFCNKNDSSLTRPLEMKDKTLCHIIALSLICCNFQINLKLLANETFVHLLKLTKLAKVVGAVPLLKNSDVFVLKLPLPSLPKSSKRNSQRK